MATSLSTLQARQNRHTSPLSLEQEHLWNKQVPNIPPLALRILGPLSAEVFCDALNGVVRRHEALRTIFREFPVPHQVILSDVRVDFSYEDLTELPDEERSSAANRRILNAATRPFDIYIGPLLRAGLLRIGSEEHIFFFTMHHIIADLWSFRLFIRELGLFYSGYLAGERLPLPPARMQYAGYAAWQKEWADGDLFQVYRDYWQAKLDGMRALQLNLDHPRSPEPACRGRVESISISRSTTASLCNVSRSQRATLFMTLLAAFKVLLYELTQQEDIALSTLVANRTLPETEAMIGVFANRLILRTKIKPDAAFGDLLKDVRDTCLGAYAHQFMSFWKFAQTASAKAAADWNSMILFTLQDVPLKLADFGDLRLEPLHATGPTVFEDRGMAITGRFDQSWEVWRCSDKLVVTVTYPAELFHLSTVRRMLTDFRLLLDHVASDPTASVRALADCLNSHARCALSCVES